MRTAATGGACRCAACLYTQSCVPHSWLRAPRGRAAATSGARQHVCASSRRRCAQQQPVASAAVPVYAVTRACAHASRVRAAATSDSQRH
eukprot:1339439-Pleurochrysis_carterae.AAC.1